MANFRIGVIGHTGRGNYGHGIDTVWSHVPGCEVVAVSDPDKAGQAAAKDRLQTSVTYSDYRKMLNDEQLDIVAICPRWLDQHRDMVLAAAEKGLHIYMEKPFCRTLEEADQMVAVCQTNKVKLAIAHQTRYSPTLRVIRELIEDGRIGNVLELRGRGKEDSRGGGEDLWVLGSHIFNMMHFFGGEPKWCYAQAYQNGAPVTKEDVYDGNEGIGPLAASSLTAMYGMQDGIHGYFASTRSAGNGARFALQIYGSKGVFDIKTGFRPLVFLLEDPNWCPGRSGQNWQRVTAAGVGKPEVSDDNSLHAGNVAACIDLIAAIKEDRQPECNMYEARTTVEMIAAVYESHRQSVPVAMPLNQRKNPLTLLKR
ncbi:MAG: Gfo/Idh/MocA family oxidoreductase [Planctomycetota bacterium]|nr:Gfo/Idh/MocA family oxidoreductase [Planctomycetota bacterium]